MKYTILALLLFIFVPQFALCNQCIKLFKIDSHFETFANYSSDLPQILLGLFHQIKIKTFEDLKASDGIDLPAEINQIAINISEVLIKSNINALSANGKKVDEHSFVSKVTLLFPHESYPYFLVTIANLKSTAIEKILVRSNLKTAFLSESYQYRFNFKTDTTFAIFNNEGKIITHPITSAILTSLLNGKGLFLYRVMPDEEFIQWKNGSIKNRRFSYGFPKVHFSIGPYKFGNKNFRKFFIPEDVLLKLLREGNLEINTYESFDFPLYSLFPMERGMPKEAQTSFGIEVELNILHIGGIDTIAPFMKTESE